MGIVYTKLRLANPARPQKKIEVRFLVDSGAVYSVVPKETLTRLGIKPHSERSFSLADGQLIERKIGDALFFYRGTRGASPVVFGQKGDSCLLGAVTLEALGLVLNSFKRELKPLPMLLV